MKPRKDLSTREVEDLHQRLMRRLGDSSVPTLPEVAVRVIQLVGNPNSTLKQFVDVVQTDQALTGRLLRSANSAAFAQRQPVTQLQRAMVLLGLDRLKAMALGFHLSQAAAMDEGAHSFKRLWSKSLFRAWTAFRLTEYFDRTITGEAFIVGLMMDAGIPMMPRLVGDDFGKVFDPNDIPQKQHQNELNLLEFTHVDVMASLAMMWRLPALLARPIMMHHTSPDAMDPRNPNSVLHAVAYFVGTLTLENDLAPSATGAAAATARRLFGLTPEVLSKAFKNAAADFRSSQQMFTHVLDGALSVEQILASANAELTDPGSDTAGRGGTKSPAVRFETDGLVLEIEAAGSKKVTVFIADAGGNRLLSEEITPAERSASEIRRILMLENAPEALVNQVVSEVRRLAA